MTLPADGTTPDEIIRAELEPGEELLWAGRPRQGLVLRLVDVMPMFAGAILFAFPILVVALAARGNAPPPAFAPMLFVMVAYGGVVLFGRPFFDVLSRSRMTYGVTSERALFVMNLFGRRVRSLEFDSLVDCRLRRSWRGDGGVIRFGSDAGKPDQGPFETRQWFSVPAFELFELGDDAQAVFGLVKQALRRSPRGRRHTAIERTQARPTPDAIPWDQPDDVVRAELTPGEVLLWAGRPRTGFTMNWFSFVVAFVAFIWMNWFLGGGFANQQRGVVIVWYLLLFKVVHVLVHVGRSIADARFRARTAYGVTSRRVVVVTAGYSRQVDSLALDALAIIALTESPKTGGGTVLFGPDIPRPPNASRARPGAIPPGMIRFALAADARLVFRLLRRARRPLSETV